MKSFNTLTNIQKLAHIPYDLESALIVIMVI